MTSHPVMSRLTPELPLCVKFICLSKAMVDYKSTISVWLMASVKLKSHEFRWALGTTTRRTSHARFPWSSSALWCDVQYRYAWLQLLVYWRMSAHWLLVLVWQQGALSAHEDPEDYRSRWCGQMREGSSHVGPHWNNTFKCDKC